MRAIRAQSGTACGYASEFFAERPLPVRRAAHPGGDRGVRIFRKLAPERSPIARALFAADVFTK